CGEIHAGSSPASGTRLRPTVADTRLTFLPGAGAEYPPMSRPVLLLFVCLAVALAGFGLLADRALVREAATAAALSSAKSEQDSRAAALSVRGALGQIEQDLLAGRGRVGVRQQTLALPP